jgi:predicted glutamine amidotransferase
MGEKNKENAHPFSYGRYNGIHNGWLIDNYRRKEINKICEEFGYDNKLFSVDSKLIFYHIERQKKIEAIGDIEGSMALAIIEESSATEKQDYLYLYRRESKPLYVLE